MQRLLVVPTFCRTLRASRRRGSTRIFRRMAPYARRSTTFGHLSVEKTRHRVNFARCPIHYVLYAISKDRNVPPLKSDISEKKVISHLFIM